MIDEKMLTGIKSRLPPKALHDTIQNIATPVKDYVEILDTLEALWKVAQAAENLMREIQNHEAKAELVPFALHEELNKALAQLTTAI